MFQGGGDELVLPGVGFETQGFGPQSVVESDSNLVRFALELRTGHRGFWEIFRRKLKFFVTLPIVPISGECGQITGRASGSSANTGLRLRMVVTRPSQSRPASRSPQNSAALKRSDYLDITKRSLDRLPRERLRCFSGLFNTWMYGLMRSRLPH